MNKEIEWLLEKATGLSSTELRLKNITQDTLEPKAKKIFLNMMEQRKNNIPLQYILGRWEFMGLPINCRPGVLIPRFDTEVLAEEAIKFLKKQNKPRVLDLCTGSGCIAISLASFCQEAEVNAVDISPIALDLAKENAQLNNLKINFLLSDLFENVDGKFDCITVNPPYIPSGEIINLQEEVQQEPTLALDGGVDGLDFYRAIISTCSEYMNANAAIFLEIGYNQAQDVTDMLQKCGFKNIKIIKDLENRHRVVQAEKGK